MLRTHILSLAKSGQVSLYLYGKGLVRTHTETHILICPSVSAMKIATSSTYLNMPSIVNSKSV